jgi:hypothetical protein
VTETRQGALATYRTPRRLLGGAFCVSLVALAAAPLSRGRAQGAGEILVEHGVKISMRVGAPLLARVYRVPGVALRPAVLSLEADSSGERDRAARALASAGYAVVVAAPRGGDDKHVGRDGYDAVEWIGAQRWSDRHVVMTGTGEGANAAWNAAREHPRFLDAIVSRVPARALGWSATDLDRLAIPVLTIGGASGEPQGAALATFSSYSTADAKGAARAAYLVMGSLGADDLERLEREWFDWALGKGRLPPLLRGHVTWSMAGEDRSWRSADSFAAIGALPTSYPLHSNAGQHAPPGGFLGEAARDEEPADTVGASALTYETLLGATVEITGSPSVTLWLGNAGAASVEATIEEVRPDGSAALIGRSAGRAQAAGGPATTPPGPARWEFGDFGWIATRLAKGNTLRLAVRSRVGVVVHHDIARYSRVILPLVRAR